MAARAEVHLPSEVSPDIGAFDRFATRAANIASRASFFVFCVLLVLLWAPSLLVLRDVDTWQLIINTATTIITFLLVALLQNSQTRADQAVQHKLNAVAEGLADVLTAVGAQRMADNPVAELRDAVGLEDIEGSAGNSRLGTS